MYTYVYVLYINPLGLYTSLCVSVSMTDISVHLDKETAISFSNKCQGRDPSLILANLVKAFVSSPHILGSPNDALLFIELHPEDAKDILDYCKENDLSPNSFLVNVLMQRMTLYNRGKSYWLNGRYSSTELDSKEP